MDLLVQVLLKNVCNFTFIAFRMLEFFEIGVFWILITFFVYVFFLKTPIFIAIICTSKEKRNAGFVYVCNFRNQFCKQSVFVKCNFFMSFNWMSYRFRGFGVLEIRRQRFILLWYYFQQKRRMLSPMTGIWELLMLSGLLPITEVTLIILYMRKVIIKNGGTQNWCKW